jgi:hypothetical protein
VRRELLDVGLELCAPLETLIRAAPLHETGIAALASATPPSADPRHRRSQRVSIIHDEESRSRFDTYRARLETNDRMREVEPEAAKRCGAARARMPSNPRPCTLGATLVGMGWSGRIARAAVDTARPTWART